MTENTIKFSNMPTGLDNALTKKRDALIAEGKHEFREILKNNNTEENSKVRAVIAAKKGAYSRKFYQYAKELYIVELFERNNIPMSFKNFNVISQKIFGESLDKSLVSKMEKDAKYGKGVQSEVVIENEAKMIEKLKFAIKLMVTPYREEVLLHLKYDNIFDDYVPKSEKKNSKSKRAKL